MVSGRGEGGVGDCGGDYADRTFAGRHGQQLLSTGEIHPLSCARRSRTSRSARRSFRSYSRLIGAGEERTLGRLRALCREFAAAKIKKYRGCIVKIMGAGLLLGSAGLIGALGIFCRRHGREESVIKLTLAARWSAYDAHG